MIFKGFPSSGRAFFGSSTPKITPIEKEKAVKNHRCII